MGPAWRRSVCLALTWMAMGTAGLRAASPFQVDLADIDSGLTSPEGVFRWLDVADQAYAASYQAGYNYTQATVRVDGYSDSATFHGTLTASGLKPNFAYQFKIVGQPETDPQGNERVGLAGRWWQEEWDGTAWVNGHNLNDKGDGTSPNPNDIVYLSLRDVADPTSPTGLKYRFVGYMLFDYFVTDQIGNAVLPFEATSSYHVLWKTSQRTRTAVDGPLVVANFDPDPAEPAYDVDYPLSSAEVFGEWERLPVGGIFPKPGSYTVQLLLTEESFHGTGLAGGWAAAMGGQATFHLMWPGDIDEDLDVDSDDLGTFLACMTGSWAGYDLQDLPEGCDVSADGQGFIPPDLDADGDVDLSDFGLFQRCMTGPDVEPDPTCTEDL